jgi:hypothetical protein
MVVGAIPTDALHCVFLTGLNLYVLRNNNTFKSVANCLYFYSTFWHVSNHHQVGVQYIQKRKVYQNEASALQKLDTVVILKLFQKQNDIAVNK